MYWEGEKECNSREALKQLQLERLQAAVLRVYMNVPFYRKKFDELGMDPDSFRSLEDVGKLPFTSKDDLRMSYPYGMFAVPLREVVRVQASSGTTGMPTAVGNTRNDIKNWSNLAARILVAGGVTQNYIVQMAFDYGLFSGALGMHYGAERIDVELLGAAHVTGDVHLLPPVRFRVAAARVILEVLLGGLGGDLEGALLCPDGAGKVAVLDQLPDTGWRG